MKRILLSILVLTSVSAVAQDTLVHLNPNPDTDITGKRAANAGEVYNLKAKVDIPVTLAAAGFTLFGFSKVYSRDKISRIRNYRTADRKCELN